MTPLLTSTVSQFTSSIREIEISVILPAKNEATNLLQLVPEIATVLRAHCASFEIVIIDDGSSDQTRAMIAAQLAHWQNIRYLRLARNFGKEPAITAGLHGARGAAVIIMDSDGQHPPRFHPTTAARLARWCADGLHSSSQTK
jgi:polyisoprenyl-phosphate glycosyltransferase